MIDRRAGNRWKIVLIATGFNMLFEYSLRGINNLRVQPFLPFLLFAIYFVYFTLLEDLIVRYKLKDYHLMIISFFFGTVYVSFISGTAFMPRQVAGVNWGSLLFINLIWWGALQAVLTFYIANRLALRDWNHPHLSKTGWGIAIFLNLVFIRIFQSSGLIPKASPAGFISVVVTLVVTLALFWAVLPGTEARALTPTFKKDLLLDSLSVLTTIIFFVCAVFLTFDPIRSSTSNVNATSLRIVSVWTAILALIMLVYRLFSRRPISI